MSKAAYGEPGGSIPRVAQMTWYTYLNYGSVLQAYALNRVLRARGYDAKLVAYDPEKGRQKFDTVSFGRRLCNWISCRIAGRGPMDPARIKPLYDEFRASMLQETALAETDEQLRQLCETYDAFVCGSDQIWSPRCFDPHYYLDFVCAGKKRIAYAPSFGCETIPDDKRGEVRRLLGAFDFVSVREASGQRIVEELTGRKCPVVVDPTLLLSAEEWGEICVEPAARGKYCLFYFLGASRKNIAIARKVARKMDLPICIIPVHENDEKKSESCQGVGPREFLGLFKNAEYVCTDSFHGVVFASLFEKDFSVFERFNPRSTASQNTRIYSYLEAMGLKNRLIGWQGDVLPADKARIDFENVRERIRRAREKSLDYLIEALSERSDHDWRER